MRRYEKIVEEYLLLTDMAIKERDDNLFLEILMRRSKIKEGLIKECEDISWIKKEVLEKEQKILERLERMKRDLFCQMESLSKKRRLLRIFSSHFPFPSMPTFFEDKE